MQKVVDLSSIRGMLDEVENVRQQILRGEVVGVYAALMRPDGREEVHLGGTYRSDPSKAARAILRTSAARMMAEDAPPLFQQDEFLRRKQ